MPYRSGARAVSDLKAHLVLTTKYRKKVLSAEMLSRLSGLIQNFCHEWGCDVIEFDGDSDHVHLLFRYYPQIQISKFVNSLKTTSSRLIRKEFPDEVQRVYRNPVLWHSSYFIASCGGVTVDVLRKYIENQSGEKPHALSQTSAGMNHLN